jgi:CheY-like chemotaxis protein
MKKHILLIDDDKDEVKIFMDALAQADGHAVKCTYASATEQAMEMLKYLVPDLIFVDFNMPRMTGLAFLAEIKRNESLQDIPVYLYSTTINAETEKNAKLLGAAGCIEKPNSISTLAREIKQILEAGPEVNYAFFRK